MTRRLALALLSFMILGCASVVNGRFHTVSVDSFPSGATIAVDCGDVPRDGGVTPAKVQVERAADKCNLTFAKVGYETRSIALEHQFSRATALNAVWGVPTGLLVGALGFYFDSITDGDGETGLTGLAVGWGLGFAGATALDAHGGAMKWTPGRVFVTMVRTELANGSPDKER